MIDSLLVERPQSGVSLNYGTYFILQDIFCMQALKFDFLVQLPKSALMPAHILNLDVFFAVLCELWPVFADRLVILKESSVPLNSHQDISNRLA